MPLEDEQFTKWRRRPTIFIANAWYLMAAAGQTIVGYVAVFIVQLIALFGVSMSGGALTHLANTAYEIGILGLPVIIYAAQHEGVSQSMRLNRPRLDMTLYAALAAITGVLLSNNLGTWWMLLIEKLGGRLYSSAIPAPTTPSELMTSILLVGIVPGVCEELFFRGGLMGAWERRGTQQALFITTVLFTMLHASLLGLPTQLLMGAVLGYVLLLSDSLYVSMLYHSIHNSFLLVLAYMNPGDASAQYGSLSAYIGMETGYSALIASTAMTAVLFLTVISLMTAAHRRQGKKIEQITEGDKEPMNWQELIVLIAGVMTVCVMYINDFLRVCGAE